MQTPVPVLFPGPDNACSGATPSCTEVVITYEGAAPMLVAGVIQVNVRLPDSFPGYLTLPGPVPVKMRIPNGPPHQCWLRSPSNRFNRMRQRLRSPV